MPELFRAIPDKLIGHALMLLSLVNHTLSRPEK